MSYLTEIVPQEDQNEISPIDPKAFRKALGAFATGVAVVTTIGDKDRPVGLTINSFSSVSLDPPLILWSIANSAGSFDAFARNDRFAVNILSATQQDLALRFCRPAPDKFAGIDFAKSEFGMPLLSDAVAYFDCRVHARHPGGDHKIYLGAVDAFISNDDEPLLFHAGMMRALDKEITNK